MQISLSEKEITAGVVHALNARGFQIDPATVTIVYSQGRKGNGLTATLDTEAPVAALKPQAPVSKPASAVVAEPDPVLKEPKAAETPVAEEPAPEVAEPVAEAPADAQPVSLFQ